MPIPDFNADGVLPPHKGNPRLLSELSPFPATALEVCQNPNLCNSPARRRILRGWLEFRKLLREIGFSSGFQWVDGSFTEDAENRRGRPPSDIDVVSFLPAPPTNIDPAILQVIEDQNITKENYKVHHMVIYLEWPGELIVEWTRYYCGLFSHRKDDFVWKGMLKIDLNTIADDDAAKRHLDSLENT